jgi:hypothetical protein
MSRRYTSTATSPPPPALLTNAEGCLSTQVGDGTVIVFSDAHYSDLPPTTAHRALVRHAKISAAEGHLRAVVNGGDALDLASISRHPARLGVPGYRRSGTGGGEGTARGDCGSGWTRGRSVLGQRKS